MTLRPSGCGTSTSSNTNATSRSEPRGSSCPDGRVVQIEPDWFGKLSGFTPLFEALVLAMAQQMTFAAVARLVDESWHRVHAICSHYVDLAVAEADLSKVAAVAIDETACRRGHDKWRLKCKAVADRL